MYKEFLYFLAVNGQSQEVNEDDIVIGRSQLSPLKHAPDGWQTKMVKYARSMKYWGLFRGYTIPMRFVLDGATILRNMLYTSGYEAELEFIILKLNPATEIYEDWYKGEIHLVKTNDSLDFVEVNVREGGAPKLITANEGTTYEFPLDESAETIVLDGIQLKNTVKYVIQPGPGMAFQVTVLGCIYVDTDGVNRDQFFNSTSHFVKADNTLDPAGTDYLVLNNGVPVTLKIKAKYTIKKELIQNSYSVFYGISNGTAFINDPVYVFSEPIIVGEWMDVEFEFNVTINNNERLFLMNFGGSQMPAYPIIYGENGTLEIAFDYTHPATTIRGFTQESLFKKLMLKVTEGITAGSAPILQMTGSGTETDPARTILLTSGDGIRGLDDSVVKTSFNEFYQAMDVQHFVGFDCPGDVPTMEGRGKYFSGDVVYDLGQVKKCSISVAEDLIFNYLKIGYPDQEYNDVNGRTEYNTVQEYSLPVKQVAKQQELISTYRGDCYGQEFERVNLDGKTTTDSESDNDVFMIDCYGIKDETGRMIWRPYRANYTSIEGVLTNTVYNVEMSPKRLFFKHSGWMRSFLFGLDHKIVTFQTSSKNANLKTTLETGPVTEVVQENSSEPVNLLGNRLFLPFYFDVTAEAPLNFLQLIAASRAGKFRFEWDGVRYIGVLWEGGIEPKTLEEQTFKFLATPENDPKNWIR